MPSPDILAFVSLFPNVGYRSVCSGDRTAYVIMEDYLIIGIHHDLDCDS